MGVLALVKLHGLGNDFLACLDGEALDAAAGELAVSQSGLDRVAGLAWALCDRHFGIGADGLLVLRDPVSGGDVRMELRNADGGRAETSGNGLRCFALAVIEAGIVSGPAVAIETDAGTRRAAVVSRGTDGSGDVTVEMGTVRTARSEPVAEAGLPGSRSLPWPAWSVDAGNPHLVLLAPALGGIALCTIGPELENRRPGGQNVEFVAYEPAKAMISLVVWERGAGATLACGSGSVAAAAALHSAGISPPVVRVHNPGGTAEVSLAGDDPLAVTAQLGGPVQKIARVEIDPRELRGPSQDVAAS